MSRDYIALAAQYQADVIAGRLPACRWVQLACARNRRDLDRQGTAEFPYHFDPVKARRICQFAEMLPHVKGPKAVVVGQDEEGRNIWATIRLEPWQCWVLTTLFGWVDAAGLRRFRWALILIPRKSGKSVLGAIVSLYMLTLEGESGAEVYSAATTRDQAKVVAEIAWEMAKRSPQFREHFGVKLGSQTTRSLSLPAMASKFLPLSADANSLDGLNVLCAVIDELHAHKTRGVVDVLDTATGARLQPLIFAITTAGVEIGGICHEKLGYLEKVLDGVAIDEAFFGANWTIDAGDDIADEVVQRKANPNYGVSVQPDDLRRKIAEAQQSPAAMNNVLTKHFNVWIRTESGWMTATLWETCKKVGLTLEALKAFPCWVGIDLSEIRDIAAVSLVFKLSEDTYACIGKYFWPKASVDKSPTAQVSGWVRQGFIEATAGNQTDFAQIEKFVLWVVEHFKVQEIDFDRALAAHMQQNLRRELEPKMGRDAVDRFVVTVPQDTPTMDRAMKFCERLVLAGKLQHDGNPVLTWMVSNVVVERNQKDEIYPRKAGGKDSHNKIDGAVAFFNALSRAMFGEVAQPEYRMFFFGPKR